MASIMPSNNFTKDELQEYLVTHTNAESAIYFGVGVRTIARWRNKYNLTNFIVRQNFPIFTEKQNNILSASMLGDGHILKKYPRFQLGQKIQNQEYVKWIYDLFQPYSSNLYVDNSNALYPSSRMYTHTHPSFIDLRSKWYNNSRKIIPKDLKLNKEIILHWYLQDGYNHQKKKCIRISTNCFSFLEVEELAELIQIEFNLKATVYKQNKQPVIYFNAREYYDFMDLIKNEVNWDCFKYKVDTSLASCDSNLGAGKLDQIKADNIRRLFEEGKAIPEIAKEFQVSIKSIYNVLNNVTYKVNKDYAEVKVIYSI